MDDSDDYFVDDIALDDDTLALLDREEQRYLASQKTTFADAPPISKKRKTDCGWKPGFVHHWDSGDDFENLPEISVQDDGTYGVNDITRNTKNNIVLGHASNSNTVIESERDAARATTTTVTPTARREATYKLHRSTKDDPESRNGPIPQPPPSRAKGSDNSHTLQTLQHEIRKLYAENQRIQLALRQEIDARLTKEGEVTILRKGMEKTAQEYAAQISGLKTAKDEAIDKQVQIQKEMKEEIERIKTQLMFKQQEIESSLRRAPPSARVHKTCKDPFKTPIHKLSWELGSDTPGPKLLSESGKPGGLQHAESPIPRRSLKTSTKTGGLGVLPGFQNAFMASPTMRRQTDIFCQDGPSGLVSKSPLSSPTRLPIMNFTDYHASLHLDHHLENDMPNLTEYGEAEMPIGDEDDRAEDNSTWEDIECQPVSWTTELSRIILTHSMPNSAHPTLHLMLATSPVPKDTDATQVLEAGSDILQIIASLPTIHDVAYAVRRICSRLVTMLLVVGNSNEYHSTQSLLNLLTTLVFSIPEFGTHLLSFVNNNSRSSCASAIRDFIVHRFNPTIKLEAFESLARELFSFLEIVCLRGKEDSIAGLTPLLLDSRVWATLLHSGQPEWFLTRSCRLLVLFGSHRILARELLNVNASTSTEGQASTDQGGLLLIDRLSTLLTEAIGPHDKVTHILTFFGTLSLSHPESLGTLINNDYLIPSLVCFLSHLTDPLWEEDERLRRALHAIPLLIRMANQTLTLIHYLVFAADSSFNLRLLLHHNARRTLAGLHHTFIVTCGRLSYADPPTWIDKNGRYELELLSDLARELLDLVVDGPESDSVWSIYQEDLDKNESEPDEGEMEARLLGD